MQNPYLHRFSLRALLGLLLFVCVVLGIVASRACRQRHAVEIVTSMGGSADYDYQWWRSWRDDTWVDLSLSFPRPVPWIANLLGVDFIAPVTSVSLDLDNEYLGRLEVQRVLELPSLSRLSLMKGHLSSKTLSQIARLSRLRILDLTDTDLTDDGLKKLSCNGLECLDISGTDVGDKGLSHLAALPDLYALYLRDTRITDAGLEQISGQPQISQLDLSAKNFGQT